MKFDLILSVFLVFAVASGCDSGPGNSGNGAALGTAVQLSQDPFTDAIAQHQTAVEPSILAQGSTIVSAYQVGRIAGGASVAIGWSTSKDGGATWSRGVLPGLTSDSGGTDLEVTDAVVAYDASHGVWMIESIIFPNSGSSSSVVVSRSTDGLTWSAPVTVASGTQDKCWISCDNGIASAHPGHCYAVWDDISTQQIFTSVSTDGGLTWSSPKATADSATGIGAQFAILPSGIVVMPFYNYNSSDPQILASTSTDGGQTWSASTLIARPQTTSIPTRGETDPQVAVQPNGTINVAWYDCRFESGCSANDIVMVSSTDGATWSNPIKISPEATGSGRNHFLPALAADSSNGKLALSYYTSSSGCSGSNCSAKAWFSASADNGQTWTAPLALTSDFPLTQVASSNEGPMLGDYFGIAFASGAAFPAFSAPANTAAAALNQQIFTIAIVPGF